MLFVPWISSRKQSESNGNHVHEKTSFFYQKGKAPHFTEETGVTINTRSEPYYRYQRKSTRAPTKVIPTMQLHCQLSQRLHQK